MANEKVLSYKDTLLRRSDLDILKGPCYLNDEIIGFHFQYLSSCFDYCDLLLVPPSISFWLTNIQSPDDAKENVEPMKLCDKKIVIFPINNNDVSEAGDGGTHWSVLVYYRDLNSFIHHDSMQGVNNDCATTLYEVVKGFVGAPSSSKVSSKGKHNNKKKKGPQPHTKCNFPAFPDFNEYEMTPQQSNGYDCGLYVMAIARTICEWHATKSRGKDVDWFSTMEQHVNVLSVEMAMRSEVIKLIEELRVQSD